MVDERAARRSASADGRRWSGGPVPLTVMSSTLEWLRGRDDAALCALLRARPDLTVPAPTDLSVLARRLDSPPSVWRALEGLNRFAVQVLESVVLLGDGGTSARTTNRRSSDAQESDTQGLSTVASDTQVPSTVPSDAQVQSNARILSAVASDTRVSGTTISSTPVSGTTVSSNQVSSTQVSNFLGRAAPTSAVKRVFAELETLALIRGGDAVQPSPAVGAAMGEFPGGFGPRGRLSTENVTTALAAAGDEGRALLARLGQGRPRGSVGTTGSLADLVRSLVGDGLLIRLDPGSVVLPREVGLVLRGDAPLGPVHVQSPPVEPGGKGERTVDGTAAGQALAAVAISRRMLDSLGRMPAPALRSGGMGVREMRRLAKDLDLDAALTALHVELLAAAGLIATSEPRSNTAVNSWVPTSAADEFSDDDDEQSWALLAATWLDLRRDPSRTGGRDAAGKVLAALSAELSWVRGPADRRFVLGALAQLPPGSGLEAEALSATLAWMAPLRSPDRRDPMAQSVVAEGTALGVVAFSALSGAGRALLTADRQAAAEALKKALPDPVDTLMVQADLTVVAPGRLEPELAAKLAAAAEVESAGSATVYRVTPDSLRRAFDAGASSGDLHDLFQRHSVTGVPQSLTYLIDDVARRHGVLRVGAAASYLRSEDPSLIDQAIAQATASGMLIRRLAPTVAISTSRLEDLLAPLRSAGLVPAAEDASGGVIDLRAALQRTPGAVLTPARRREPPTPSDDQLVALIERMRSADAVVDFGRTQSPQESMTLLRQAVEDHRAVWIGYVDSEGGTTRRLIEPVAVSGGAVAAFDRLRESMRTFALHRITGVQPVTSPEHVGSRPDQY